MELVQTDGFGESIHPLLINEMALLLRKILSFLETKRFLGNETFV